MFQPFYENINIILWIILGLVIFCILLFFLMGIVIKKRGVMCFETLLIGEEYLFSSISSVVIYLIFSFPVALILWLFTYFSMYFVFKKNRKLLGFISYYENDGKRKTPITKEHTHIYTQINHWFYASQVFSWITDVRKLKNEVLCKIDCEIDHHRLCFKDRMVPFSCFASGTFGIGTAFFVYGDLIQNKNSFIAILIENYALVSCLLYVLYWLFYFAEVKYIWGSFCGSEKLYKAIFAVWAVIAYTAVTYISMNWNYTGL